jgi:hypothetical protein
VSPEIAEAASTAARWTALVAWAMKFRLLWALGMAVMVLARLLHMAARTWCLLMVRTLGRI